MTAMLRRRLMSGGKKMWTIEVQDNSAAGYSANNIYPLISGERRGPGVYKVNDGDTITLYALGNTFAAGVIQVNGTTVAIANPNRGTDYAYKVNSNCKIEVIYLTTGSSSMRGVMNTDLTT